MPSLPASTDHRHEWRLPFCDGTLDETSDPDFGWKPCVRVTWAPKSRSRSLARVDSASRCYDRSFKKKEEENKTKSRVSNWFVHWRGKAKASPLIINFPVFHILLKVKKVKPSEIGTSRQFLLASEPESSMGNVYVAL